MILVPIGVPQIPALSEEILEARQHLQENIIINSPSFDWLNKIQSYVGQRDFEALSRTVHITSSGGLSICSTSLFTALHYDSTLYYGTVKSWIIPTIEFSILNPARCYRYVSIYIFS